MTNNVFQIGDSASFSKTITETDVYQFAGITGDFNPAHINEEYAKTTSFKTRIVHGVLTAGLISAVLGTKLPGPGTIYMGQNLKFTAPIFFGDTITATVTIKEIDNKQRCTLITQCKNQNGELVLDGTALVKLPEKE